MGIHRRRIFVARACHCSDALGRITETLDSYYKWDQKGRWKYESSRAETPGVIQGTTSWPGIIADEYRSSSD